MPDFMNPSEDLLAGLQAGRSESADTIEELNTHIAELEAELQREKRPWSVQLIQSGETLQDMGSDECIIVDVGYSDRILMVECPALKDRFNLEAKLDPPPDGFASWEDWLASEIGITIRYDAGIHVWFYTARSERDGNPLVSYAFPNYPTALAAAKKEAGRAK